MSRKTKSDMEISGSNECPQNKRYIEKGAVHDVRRTGIFLARLVPASCDSEKRK